MLYNQYDLIKKTNNIMNIIFNNNLNSLEYIRENHFLKNYPGYEIFVNWRTANNKILERLTRDYKKPSWNIDEIDNLKIKYNTIIDLPFCTLTKISCDTNQKKNKPILLVSPMSGHYATLLRETVQELLKEHDVYVTEWKNASEVPYEEGAFGLEEYINYIITMSQKLPNTYSIIAVCQPTVAVSVAVAHMSQSTEYRLPKSLVLMGGPMVLSGSENEVSELGVKKNNKWFKDNLIYEVPQGYPGQGRPVYPGFVQLNAFVSMNLDKHIIKHYEIYKNTLNSKDTLKLEEFYDEYLAVMDLDAKFYLETIDVVFRRRLLEKGKFPYKGNEYSLRDINSKVKILSIEGEKDDIAAVGQTSNALKLMTQIPEENKKSCIFEGVGHYGIFSGSKWRNEIRPTISSFV